MALTVPFCGGGGGGGVPPKGVVEEKKCFCILDTASGLENRAISEVN